MHTSITRIETTYVKKISSWYVLICLYMMLVSHFYESWVETKSQTKAWVIIDVILDLPEFVIECVVGWKGFNFSLTTGQKTSISYSQLHFFQPAVASLCLEEHQLEHLISSLNTESQTFIEFNNKTEFFCFDCLVLKKSKYCNFYTCPLRVPIPRLSW